MSTRIKRQHYVPQGYLRRFQSSAPNSKVEKIWVVDRFKDVPFNVPIQSVASRDGFYDSKIDDGIYQFENHGVENLLRQEEEKFYSALRRLDDGIKLRKCIPQDIKPNLSWYLYLQFIRTAKFRSSLSDAGEENVQDYKKLVQIYGLANREIATKFISVCISSIWVVYEMVGNSIMFTSDNPVVFIFDGAEQAMSSVMRDDDIVFVPYKGMRIMFPLDSKHVLFLYDRQVMSHKLELEDKVVDFDSSMAYDLWTSLVNNCDRQIYLSNNDSMCEVIKLLMGLDNALNPIREVLGRIVDAIRHANSSISNTRLNSYQGFLARQKAQPLFEALKKFGEGDGDT